ncbi:MAG: GntR family transcriptional regulator [Geminicoccaceae bacterium]|nr:MAG: GntR family transcriptional regulator [Geminicoccaceae bacterium]
MAQRQLPPDRSAPADPATSRRGISTSVAVERLRELILEGELAPGSRVTERAVGARLRLSRTPLREALKVLASEGLVVIEPHRGALVPLLSVEEVDEVMAVLAALEGVAAPLACARLTERDFAAIELLHGQMVRHADAGDLSGYFRANQAIHRAIVEASGNRALARIYWRESSRVQRYRFAGNQDLTRWRRAVYEHELILDALRQRDGELLQALLRAHLRAGWQVARARVAPDCGRGATPLSGDGEAGSS